MSLKKRLSELFKTGFRRSPMKRLLKDNRRVWKRFRNKRKGLYPNTVVLTQSKGAVWLYGAYALASIVARVKRGRILFFGDPPQNRRLRKGFPFSAHFYENELPEGIEESAEKEAESIWEGLSGPDDVLNIYYKDLLIGDLVYDSVLRYGKNWQATIWKVDRKVFDVLYKAIHSFKCLEYIFNKYHVVSGVFSHTAGIGGLPLRFLASREIECFAGVIGGGAIRKYSSFNGKRLPYRQSLPKELFFRIYRDSKPELVRGGMEELQKRLSGTVEDRAASLAYKDKRIFQNKEEFCDFFSLSLRPTYFIMLHAFNDMPHNFEGDIFRDYYRWFIETLKLVKEQNEVNWIFKEHPNASMYPNDANLEGIFEVINDSHILFLNRDADVSSESLKNVADGVVTCIGTAGLEMSCMGIPALLASKSFYSGFGFCYEPNHYVDYKKYLESMTSSLKPLDEESRNKALAFFYIHQKYLVGLNDNNNGILPQISHAERFNISEEEFLGVVTSQLKKGASDKFIEKVDSFVRDQNQELFFSLDYFQKIQKC